MRCYNCDSTDTEELKYFRGMHLGSIWTCSIHKAAVAEKSWEEVSGIAFNHHQTAQITHFKPHFGPPTGPNAPQGIMLGSPGTPNQYLNPFQSGTANVPMSEATSNQLQGPYASASSFSGLVAFVSGSTIQTLAETDLFAYISGSNVTVVNPTTNQVVSSGTDAATVLQSGINFLGQNQSIFLNRGSYGLSKSLIIPSRVSIVGTRSSWRGGGTLVYPFSGFPCMTLSGGSSTSISDIFFDVNQQTNYNSALLRVGGAVTLSQFVNLVFYDNGLSPSSGVAIQLDNNAGPTGPFFNIFDEINIFGFNTQIRVVVSGGAAISGAFINGNIFSNQIWDAMGTNSLQLIESQTMDFDGNTFANIQVEANVGVQPTQSIFDLATNVSGNVFYMVHNNVTVFDLGATSVYATVLPATQLTTVGCLGDYKISGTGLLRHLSLFTNDFGTTGVVSSGVGTNAWFIPYNSISNVVTNVPQSVIINPANSGTASVGTSWIQSKNLSGFIVTTAAAVNSGVVLSWTWRADL